MRKSDPEIKIVCVRKSERERNLDWWERGTFEITYEDIQEVVEYEKVAILFKLSG